MNITRLTDILIDDILVFAYCNDDKIDPDFAVVQLERIAEDIQSLKNSNRSLFLEKVAARSELAKEHGDSLLAARLKELPEHLGLA